MMKVFFLIYPSNMRKNKKILKNILMKTKLSKKELTDSKKIKFKRMKKYLTNNL